MQHKTACLKANEDLKCSNLLVNGLLKKLKTTKTVAGYQWLHLWIWLAIYSTKRYYEIQLTSHLRLSNS